MAAQAGRSCVDRLARRAVAAEAALPAGRLLPCRGGGGRPPRPKSPPIPRIVAGVTENEAVMLVGNGENLAVSEPTPPCHRACVKAGLNPGRRSDANVLLRVWVVQPVRLGCLACSKLYPMEEVLTLSRRILRGSRSVVSPGGGFNFRSEERRVGKECRSRW